MEARLKDVNALVKVKNPSLLLQMQQAQSQNRGVGNSYQPFK